MHNKNLFENHVWKWHIGAQELTYCATWRHQTETLLAICAGNSPVPAEFPTQMPVTRSCDVFFDLHPNKRMSEQWWGLWFETPSCPLWRQPHTDCIKYNVPIVFGESCCLYAFICVCYVEYKYGKTRHWTTLVILDPDSIYNTPSDSKLRTVFTHSVWTQGRGETRFLSYMIKFDTEQGVKVAPVKYEGLCVNHEYII